MNFPDCQTVTQKEIGRPLVRELSKMLDAIAQMLAAQAAKPVPPANVDTQPVLVVPQRAVVPVLKPIVGAPESISPVPLPQATPHASGAQPTSVETHQAASMNQAVDVDRSQIEQATVDQRLRLQQRLADIVAREKPLKDAKLRANLEAMTIAFAQARKFNQARQTAQDAMLSPEAQADLLAQIDAIAAKRPLTRSTVAIQQLLPKLPSASVKAWVLPSGRSLPSALPYTSPQYSDVPQTEPQYVTYSLKGFGQAIGGIGVVVDDTAPDFNGQWTAAYAAGNRFNTERWKGSSFIFPLAAPAPITSGFGWRVHPIRGDRRFHSGTDIGAPMGTPVLAAADGKVALADQLNGYGLTIILSHQNDTRETLYGHLSAMLVKPGQWVEKGTVIGRVGSTGLSTGPHLHFELRQKTSSGWQAIDPGAQLKYALAQLVKAMQSG